MISDKDPLKTTKGLIGGILGAIAWLLAISVLDIYGKSQAPVMALVSVVLGAIMAAVTVGTIFDSSSTSRRKALIGAFIGLATGVVIGLLSYYSALQLIAMAAMWAIAGAFLFQVRKIFS